MTRFALSSAALLALGLVVSRCSPIAASLPKAGLGVAGAPHTNGGAAKAPSTTAPTLSQIRIPLQPHVVPVPDEVDGDGDGIADDDQDEQSAGRVRLTDEQLAQLRSEGQTRLPQLTLTSVPQSGDARFEVSLSAEAIRAGGLEKFEADLRTSSDGVWTLSLLPGATTESQAAQIQVKENLEAVQITLGN